MPTYSEGFWLYFSMLQNLLLVPLFYLNILYILPRLLPQRRFGLLVLVQLGAAALQYTYTALLEWLFMPDSPHMPGFFQILPYFVVLSVALGYYVFQESTRTAALQQERETEELKTELQFLRWQISPHFLFNALNNMVALARKKSDDLEPMLISLSGIMRYMLYETEGQPVTLRKEAGYLESYIRLQTIRFSKVDILQSIIIPNAPEYYIEPMLLIPFVENAFKHGIDLIEEPDIYIQLSVTGNELHFTVSNKYMPGKPPPHDDAHGIGLANVKKRLDLLYAGKHDLAIEIDTRFTVNLTLTLN